MATTFSYKKLEIYLIANGYKWTDLLSTGISSTTLAKLKKGEVVSTKTLDTICRFLKVQPGEIMEWIE
ncbi:MAG: helix-turn-helix domain-containing protein [Oscillospiraceae bacterium]